MSGAGLKLLELILLPGLVFAWGFWELYQLKKHKQKREAEKKAEQLRTSDGDGGSRTQS
ncbi:hypothetical protein [Algihabitans albus]|uniref:hypothetical protein n=1 Tax=Algihabitans albus TaxID=2164067 RepID=UPI0013C2A127|nr:hypothetical protein [Algihabitans albus]